MSITLVLEFTKPRIQIQQWNRRSVQKQISCIPYQEMRRQGCSPEQLSPNSRAAVPLNTPVLSLTTTAPTSISGNTSREENSSTWSSINRSGLFPAEQQKATESTLWLFFQSTCNQDSDRVPVQQFAHSANCFLLTKQHQGISCLQTKTPGNAIMNPFVANHTDHHNFGNVF